MNKPGFFRIQMLAEMGAGFTAAREPILENIETALCDSCNMHPNTHCLLERCQYPNAN